MSLSTSIFRKPCPACAASVSVNAARCGCGHDFESSANVLSPLETTLRDEELYESYLAARAEQAQQAARTAEEVLADNPGDPEFASAAALAREVATSIDSDLAEQRHKIANILTTLPEKAVAKLPDLKQVPIVPEMAETPWPAATMAAPTLPEPVIEIKPVKAAPASPARAPSAGPAKTTRTPAWRAASTQKATAVLAALKQAKAREAGAQLRQNAIAVEAAKRTVKTDVPLPQTEPAAHNVPRTVSPWAFRKEQASKAEKIMEARKANVADSKECPNCTSSVPIATTRCRCGFGFVTSDTELPSLTLCTGDFTALRNSLKLNLR